jgi:hypothetical protein
LLFKAGWTPPTAVPTTEAGMMRLVFEQSHLPSEWEPVFANTPLQPADGGKTRHPNTTDIAQDVKRKSSPPPGAYLVVSSQPFVARQTLNLREVYPEEEGYIMVGVGYAAPPSTPLKAFLDEIARLLYAQLQITE